MWNLGMRFYQYHPEGEIKPFQWVVSQNTRDGIGRLEPLGKTEEFCAMIRAQDNYPSRSDLQSLRSVSVQRRAEGFQSQAAWPKKCRLSKPPFAPTSREHQERPLEGGGQMAEIIGRLASPRPVGLGVTPSVHHLRFDAPDAPWRSVQKAIRQTDVPWAGRPKVGRAAWL